MSPTFEQARDFFLAGLAHYQAGRFEQAQAQFEASLSLVPGRGSTLTNLGATRLKLGRPADALPVLEEAVRHEPEHAEAWGHQATALAELGRLESALVSIERALALDPAVGHAWSLRGRLLRDLGRREEAAQAFEQALAHGGDAALNRFFLAALGPGERPAAPPRHYVEQLFDGYATRFDEELDQLNYQAPQVLARQLQAMGRRFGSALDLGCGTGRCAPLLKPLATRLAGVDLSHNMLAQADARGLYDALVQDDLSAHLGSTADRHDLVVAADVFIYVGALEAVFAGVARVLAPQGVFCFCVEELPGEAPGQAQATDLDESTAGAGLKLLPSLRYAHAEAYLRRLAAAQGFTVAALAREPLREDRRQPVPGLFLWLTRP